MSMKPESLNLERSRLQASIMVMLCLFLILVSSTQARTWSVQQDGSGEFTAIQLAVDAAAPGDTVLIGPGNYLEYSTVTLPGWSWAVDVYVYVRKDDLTIMGSDRDMVIIGPESQNFVDFSPKGVVAVQGVNRMSVSRLTFRNLREAVHRYLGSANIEDCVFMDCEIGYFGCTSSGLLISSCSFLGALDSGTFAFDSGGQVRVLGSYYSDCFIGVDLKNCANALVSDCTVEGDGSYYGAKVGIQLTASSNGQVMDCNVAGMYVLDINISDGCTVEVIGNRLEGGQGNIGVTHWSEARGSDNVLSGATYASLYVTSSTLNLSGCHILNGGGHSVYLDSYHGPENEEIQLGGNYWGTSDPAQISEWIWDCHDDPTIYAFVNYEPFSPVPVGAELKSWGEVKNLYR